MAHVRCCSINAGWMDGPMDGRTDGRSTGPVSVSWVHEPFHRVGSQRRPDGPLQESALDGEPHESRGPCAARPPAGSEQVFIAQSGEGGPPLCCQPGSALQSGSSSFPREPWGLASHLTRRVEPGHPSLQMPRLPLPEPEPAAATTPQRRRRAAGRLSAECAHGPRPQKAPWAALPQ